ncbi:MAG: hypothetical protein WEB02_09955 [Methylophaga sp.]
MSKHAATYSDMLAKCMLDYQFMEESLRFCLYRCQTLINLRLTELLPSELQLKNIDESALPRLIELFKPHTDNEALIHQLRLVSNHRDALAHQGLMLMGNGQQAAQLLSEQNPELQAFLSAAEQCIPMIQQEAEMLDKLVKQEYQRLQQAQAAQDIEIIPPLDPLETD